MTDHDHLGHGDSRLQLHQGNVIDLVFAIGDAEDNRRRAGERVLRLRAQLAVKRAILAMVQEEAADA